MAERAAAAPDHAPRLVVEVMPSDAAPHAARLSEAELAQLRAARRVFLRARGVVPRR